MPIYGLTDRQESFLRLAKIKKGEKDPQTGAPRDLDYFRLVYSYGCEDIEKAFKAIYGDKPTRINIRLAFSEIPKVWDAYYVCYEKGGRLAQAGSDERGFYWIWYRDHETKEILVRNGRAVGPNGEALMQKKIDVTQPIYSYPEKKDGRATGKMIPVYLEPEGRLSVVVPELAWVDGKPRVGYFDFCPTSPRDIGTISSELAGIELWAKRIGKDITGIPMVLTRRKEMITKNIGGVLSQGPSWVVHIEIGGEWGGKALEFMEMKALPEIVDGSIEEISVDGDFSEEGDAPEPERVFVEGKSGEALVVGEDVPEPQPEPEKADTRPYAPKVFKEKLQKMIAAIPENYKKDGIELVATENERKVLASCIDGIFGDKGVSRHPLCMWLVGHGSTAEMEPAEIKALFHVLGIKNTLQHPAQFNDPPSAIAIQEFKLAYAEATKR